MTATDSARTSAPPRAAPRSGGASPCMSRYVYMDMDGWVLVCIVCLSIHIHMHIRMCILILHAYTLHIHMTQTPLHTYTHTHTQGPKAIPIPISIPPTQAYYLTKDGERRSNLLLASGWWGLARHFHYVPEILASFFWCLPALFHHPLPYFYPVYLTILLLDRAYRDDKR
ncbi:hypothetical protein EON63_21735 [archaeon]|nr:MAG: hypothetical protein EON63_21735 [archaeon]